MACHVTWSESGPRDVMAGKGAGATLHHGCGLKDHHDEGAVAARMTSLHTCRCGAETLTGLRRALSLA